MKARWPGFSVLQNNYLNPPIGKVPMNKPEKTFDLQQYLDETETCWIPSKAGRWTSTHQLQTSCCSLRNWVCGKAQGCDAFSKQPRRSLHKDVAACCWWCCSWSHRNYKLVSIHQMLGCVHSVILSVSTSAVRWTLSSEQVKVIEQSSYGPLCGPSVGIKLQPYQRSTHWAMLITLVGLPGNEKPDGGSIPRGRPRHHHCSGKSRNKWTTTSRYHGRNREVNLSALCADHIDHYCQRSGMVAFFEKSRPNWKDFHQHKLPYSKNNTS